MMKQDVLCRDGERFKHPGPEVTSPGFSKKQPCYFLLLNVPKHHRWSVANVKQSKRDRLGARMWM